MLNDNPSLDKSALLERMMDLARYKLVFHNEINRPDLHKDVARTAVLDVLITIEYDPKRQLANDFQAGNGRKPHEDCLLRPISSILCILWISI